MLAGISVAGAADIVLTSDHSDSITVTAARSAAVMRFNFCDMFFVLLYLMLSILNGKNREFLGIKKSAALSNGF